jgi:hypothetical protein
MTGELKTTCFHPNITIIGSNFKALFILYIQLPVFNFIKVVEKKTSKEETTLNAKELVDIQFCTG